MARLHEENPLQLGTISFHYAALLSLLFLDEEAINIIYDKFVPEPDEDAGEDVVKLMANIQETIETDEALKEEVSKLFENPISPKKIQRLVSAWRFNSFGH